LIIQHASEFSLALEAHSAFQLQGNPDSWSAEDQLNALRPCIPGLNATGFSKLLQLYMELPSIWSQVGC
jgi:hypothetical protein